jgi:type II secretory pathway pseudopilin PulG
VSDNTRREQRGTTIIELMTVVVIVGLILTLLGFEFVSVVNSTLHSRANTDAESQARVIMSKVETHMRNAYFDYTDFSVNGTPDPVISPVPGASSGYVLFYRTVPGQLTPATTTCGNNEPCPQFESVLIEMNPLVPGELDEIDTPQPNGPSKPAIVLGTNVSNFTVTGEANNRYDIAITVSEPSGHCVNQACSFQLNDVVYVGGTQ